MKTILISASCLMLAILSAQNYTFTHGTLNASGGHQANTLYSNTTASGEYVLGEVSSTAYTGYLGFLFPCLDQSPPVITSIDDVPNDQGREVQVVWNKCAFDDVYALNTFYSVWRLDEDFPSMRANDLRSRTNHGSLNQIFGQRTIKTLSPKKQNFRENIYTEPGEILQQYKQDPDKIYYWQRDRDVWTFIDTIPALQYDEYALITPTLVDSNDAGINHATYKVVFHDIFEYYESIPDSGYSVDDLPPDETLAYIARIGDNIRISWNEVTTGNYQGNSYEELNGIWYNIYAGDSPDFICDETSYMETVIELSYDYSLPIADKMFFRVKVSDKPVVEP